MSPPRHYVTYRDVTPVCPGLLDTNAPTRSPTAQGETYTPTPSPIDARLTLSATGAMCTGGVLLKDVLPGPVAAAGITTMTTTSSLNTMCLDACIESLGWPQSTTLLMKLYPDGQSGQDVWCDRPRIHTMARNLASPSFRFLLASAHTSAPAVLLASPSTRNPTPGCSPPAAPTIPSSSRPKPRAPRTPVEQSPARPKSRTAAILGRPCRVWALPFKHRRARRSCPTRPLARRRRRRAAPAGLRTTAWWRGSALA